MSESQATISEVNLDRVGREVGRSIHNQLALRNEKSDPKSLLPPFRKAYFPTQLTGNSTSLPSFARRASSSLMWTKY